MLDTNLESLTKILTRERRGAVQRAGKTAFRWKQENNLQESQFPGRFRGRRSWSGLKRFEEESGWVSSAGGRFLQLSSLTTAWWSASSVGAAPLRLVQVQLGGFVEAVAPELGHDAA